MVKSSFGLQYRSIRLITYFCHNVNLTCCYDFFGYSYDVSVKVTPSLYNRLNIENI